MWKLKSEADEEVEYSISKISDCCTAVICPTKCKEPQCEEMCRHIYKCTCPDYSSGHTCKHLHRIHSALRSTAASSSNHHSEGTDASDAGSIFVTAEAQKERPQVILYFIVYCLHVFINYDNFHRQ